jgi:hypothetical protein
LLYCLPIILYTDINIILKIIQGLCITIINNELNDNLLEYTVWSRELVPVSPSPACINGARSIANLTLTGGPNGSGRPDGNGGYF